MTCCCCSFKNFVSIIGLILIVLAILGTLVDTLDVMVQQAEVVLSKTSIDENDSIYYTQASLRSLVNSGCLHMLLKSDHDDDYYYSFTKPDYFSVLLSQYVKRGKSGHPTKCIQHINDEWKFRCIVHEESGESFYCPYIKF